MWRWKLVELTVFANSTKYKLGVELLGVTREQSCMGVYYEKAENKT